MYTLKVQLLGFCRDEILIVDHQGSCIRPDRISKNTKMKEFSTEADAKKYLVEMTKLATRKINEIQKSLSKCPCKREKTKICMQAHYEIWKETNTEGVCSVANMIYDDILNNGYASNNAYKPVDFKYYISKH